MSLIPENKKSKYHSIRYDLLQVGFFVFNIQQIMQDMNLKVIECPLIESLFYHLSQLFKFIEIDDNDFQGFLSYLANS